MIALNISRTLAQYAYTAENWTKDGVFAKYRNLLLLAWGIGSACFKCINVHPLTGDLCIKVTKARF